MRNKPGCSWPSRLAVLALLTAGIPVAFGEDPPPAPREPPAAEPAPERQSSIEFRVRTHPEDTFKPSETVSEDFPVAFPVDI